MPGHKHVHATAPTPLHAPHRRGAHRTRNDKVARDERPPVDRVLETLVAAEAAATQLRSGFALSTQQQSWSQGRINAMRTGAHSRLAAAEAYPPGADRLARQLSGEEAAGRRRGAAVEATRPASSLGPPPEPDLGRIRAVPTTHGQVATSVVRPRWRHRLARSAREVPRDVQRRMGATPQPR
eukprot:358473-Chlamydomonas_euryale.AAC.4